MDDIDRKIVGLLAEDGRRSLADIGAVVSLSPSAVNERIRRMVNCGAIRRFTVEADHRALGFEVRSGNETRNLYGTPSTPGYDFGKEDRAVMHRSI